MSHESPQRRTDSPSSVRWIVLAIVAFASASAYLTRYCISAANTTIQADLQLDDIQMGQLMSAFALGYLLFQAPGGWLGNRFGTRFAFAFLSFCWSLSNAWTSLSALFSMMWASRFSLGAFQAGLTPLSAKILKDWIPLQARGISSALIVASMSLGGAFTLWLTGWMLARGFDWKTIFAAYSMVGIVWAIGFYAYFRTFPEDHPAVNDDELKRIRFGERPSPRPGKATHDQPDDAAGTLALAMLSTPGMWGLCVQSFFRAAGYAFFVTWYFAFLEYAYKIDKAQAGLLNSLPLIAVVLGSMAGGVMVDWLLWATGSKWISRTGIAIVALTLSGVFTLASAWTSSAAQLSMVIAVGALFSGLGGPSAWTATIDIGGRHTAVVMATMNIAGCLAGVILPLVLGNWFGQIRESGGDWNLVIYLHAAFYFAAAASWVVVNPNRVVDGRKHAV